MMRTPLDSQPLQIHPDYETEKIIFHIEQVIGFFPAIRIVGYGLLIMSLLDVTGILLRLQAINGPILFQTAGAILERIPVPILGFFLVLWGGTNLQPSLERSLVQILRWVSLLCGIAVLFTVPLILSTSLQLNAQINPTLTAQAKQQKQQLQSLEKQVSIASTQELDQLRQGWNQQPNQPDIETPDAFKSAVLKDINQRRQSLQFQLNATEKGRRMDLMTNTVKWIITAIVGGFSLLYLWYLNGWLTD